MKFPGATSLLILCPQVKFNTQLLSTVVIRPRKCLRLIRVNNVNLILIRVAMLLVGDRDGRTFILDAHSW